MAAEEGNLINVEGITCVDEHDTESTTQNTTADASNGGNAANKNTKRMNCQMVNCIKMATTLDRLLYKLLWLRKRHLKRNNIIL